MRLSGLDQGLVEYFLGHADRYSGAYAIYTDEELRKLYSKHEHVLSVRGSGNIREVEEKLQDTAATVEGYRNIITDQAKEVTELRHGLEAMKKGFDEKIDELEKQNVRASEESVRLGKTLSALEHELREVIGLYNQFIEDPAAYGRMAEYLKRIIPDLFNIIIDGFKLKMDNVDLDFKVDIDEIIEKVKQISENADL